VHVHAHTCADNQLQPIKLSGTPLAFEGDRFRPYLAAINPNVTDSQGRRVCAGRHTRAAPHQWQAQRTLTWGLADCARLRPEVVVCANEALDAACPT
jgi:hypothetical protein